MNFGFASLFFLVLLLLIPCFFLCRNTAQTYYFSQWHWVDRENPLLSWETWLKIVLFAFMVIALANPFFYDAASNSNKKGRDLILAIDASGSMAQSGFDEKDRFKNKYDTNMLLAKDFIKKRLDDNMGIVIFGTFAYTASPLTYDLSSLAYLLELTDIGMAGESTAIGEAIIQSIRTLSQGKATQKAIILLTDGYHNAGETSPKAAVEKAKASGIKIYTIGIGKSRDYDKNLLETISKETGGKSYGADSAKTLEEVYETINTLEPSLIRSENFLNTHLLYGYFLMIVWIILFGWILWERNPSLFQKAI
ncbi:MAG: VWA domain-containing protein [Campylobacterales bacterium]|nr:VWA domain-containing protein [Campylobacterales bacterium]